jgi:hypothetical protein
MPVWDFWNVDFYGSHMESPFGPHPWL